MKNHTSPPLSTTCKIERPREDSNSNQSQENTKKYTREIAAKQYKVQEYGHPTRKLEKNKGILPSNKSIDPKKRIKVLCRPN